MILQVDGRTGTVPDGAEVTQAVWESLDQCGLQTLEMNLDMFSQWLDSSNRPAWELVVGKVQSLQPGQCCTWAGSTPHGAGGGVIGEAGSLVICVRRVA